MTPTRWRAVGLGILAAGFVASAFMGRPDRSWALGAAMGIAAILHLPAARSNPIAAGTAALLGAMAAARCVEATTPQSADALPLAMLLQLGGAAALAAGVLRARRSPGSAASGGA